MELNELLVTYLSDPTFGSFDIIGFVVLGFAAYFIINEYSIAVVY